MNSIKWPPCRAFTSVGDPSATSSPATIIPRDRKSTRLNSSHTVIYTLSLHDALPISLRLIHNEFDQMAALPRLHVCRRSLGHQFAGHHHPERSEEHTSELQSHSDLHSFPTRRSADLAAADPQ